MADPDHLTASLAEFVATSSGGRIPGSAREAGRRTMLNIVALATGACRHPAVELALAAVTELGTPPRAAVLGRPQRLAPQWAALVNGMAAHVEDFDDTHLPTVIHPGAPVVPAVLALGEHLEAPGDRLLDAVVVGVEVALRVGNGICPEHFDAGWHLTSTMGHVGSAVAAAHLLDLDAAQIAQAVAIGATQAAGLQAALGTMTKSFHPGKAAADGIEAAMLAAVGLTGPVEPVGAVGGLARTTSSRFDPAQMLDRLGSHWEIEDNAIKPYSCGIVSHPVIDATSTLRERGLEPDAVTEIVATVNPVVLDVMGVKDPADGLQSKFSVYHCAAVGLLDQAGGPPQFSDARARAAEVVALRARVRTVLDPSIAKDETRVTATTADGTVWEQHIEHATASAANPMTDDQLHSKAVMLAEPVLGGEGAERLILALERGDDPPTAAAIAALSIPDLQEAA